MRYIAGPGFFIFLVCFFIGEKATAQKGYQKSVIREGIRLDVFVSQVKAGKSENEFREGDDVRIHFRITDTVSGKGLSGASPAAWMDRERENQTVDCGKKIKSFIEGGFLNRPELDLNTYFVCTLNNDNTINVVNPLFGFGGSQLLAQIQLPAPGFDWLIKEDQSRVFVSMPAANQLAVISTQEIKNTQNILLPGQPRKLALQADEHYLWVSFDAVGKPGERSGVAVIDAGNNTLVKTIATGNGPHEIIIDEENKQVFVSNSGDSTISIIGMNTLNKIKDVDLKDSPVSMAWSSKAGTLYVVKKIVRR